MTLSLDRLDRNPALFYGLSLFVLGIAAWLRFSHFGQQIVLDDEWHALHALMRLNYAELFATFGHADHSIPIALWLKWLAEHVGLNEWRMGLPFLVTGMATVVLLPWCLRQHFKRSELLSLAALLAISPLLIYYSHQARPYAFLCLLMPVAIVALWHYRINGGIGSAVGFIFCAVLSAWLHPLMLAWLGWALLVAAGFSIHDGRRGHGWGGLVRMVAIGGLMLLLATALLVWPVLNDFAALRVKTGTHTVEWQTFWIAWQLFVGSGAHWLGVIALGLAGWGAYRLAHRDRAFVIYWLLLSIGSVGMIAATDAAWLHHGLVLARYSVPLHIFALVLLAVGLVSALQVLTQGRWILTLSALFLAGLYGFGPLPEIRQTPNAWAKHLYYQFDYRVERNLFRLHLDAVGIPQAYEKIAAVEGPGRVFEAGWWFESHFNPLVRYQALHRREMKIVMLSGSCLDWTYGEFPDQGDTREQHRFRMNHFLHFSELEDHIEAGDFLVFQKQVLLPDVRERPDHSDCVEQAEAAFGQPWFEDEDTLVFRNEVD